MLPDLVFEVLGTKDRLSKSCMTSELGPSHRDKIYGNSMFPLQLQETSLGQVVRVQIGH